jgi:hypothetical protein
MSQSNVAIIGGSLAPFKRLGFLTDANLYEYDTIILDPECITIELAHFGGPPYPEFAGEKFFERCEILANWISAGHTLIFLARRQISLQFVSNTGGIRDVIPASIQDMPIFEGLNFRNTTGTRVEFCGPSSVEAILNSFADNFRYETIIDGPQIQPLLRVQTSTGAIIQSVGCANPLGEGKVICMPLLVSGDAQLSKNYLTALATLPGSLTAQKYNLPEWVDQFCTDSEQAELGVVASAEAKIVELKAQITAARSSLAAAREFKALFAGTGMEFVDAVAAALRELGLNCVDGPHPRADLLASNGVRFAAIEAKGLDGNARERNFRQVERWKAEVNSAISLSAEECKSDPDLRRYREQLEMLGPLGNISVDCKAVMIIGTFRNTPLFDRKTDDFPVGVLRLLPLAGVCAMTGLQLFTLTMLARKDPTKKTDFVNAIFDTAGLLNFGSNWQEILFSK